MYLSGSFLPITVSGVSASPHAPTPVATPPWTPPKASPCRRPRRPLQIVAESPSPPRVRRPNPACCPASPSEIAPPGAHYNLSPHSRSPRAASPLEKSSTFPRSARRMCESRAIRLPHPCYNLRGALANPQEESPPTRKTLSTPSLVPLLIPRENRPEPVI